MQVFFLKEYFVTNAKKLVVFKKVLNFKEKGYVLSVKDSITEVFGLKNVSSNDLEFKNNLKLNLKKLKISIKTSKTILKAYKSKLNVKKQGKNHFNFFQFFYNFKAFLLFLITLTHFVIALPDLKLIIIFFFWLPMSTLYLQRYIGWYFLLSQNSLNFFLGIFSVLYVFGITYNWELVLTLYILILLNLMYSLKLTYLHFFFEIKLHTKHELSKEVASTLIDSAITLMEKNPRSSGFILLGAGVTGSTLAYSEYSYAIFARQVLEDENHIRLINENLNVQQKRFLELKHENLLTPDEIKDHLLTVKVKEAEVAYREAQIAYNLSHYRANSVASKIDRFIFRF